MFDRIGKVATASTLVLLLQFAGVKPVKAEPITGGLLLKLLGILLTAGSIWAAYEEVSRAEIDNDRSEVLGHYGERSFPMESCVSPSLQDSQGNLNGDGWLVSIQETPYAELVVKENLCKQGPLGKVDGRLVIGIAADRYTAQKMANVFNDMTDGDFEAVRSTEAVEL